MSDRTDHPPLPEAFAALGVRNSLLRGLAEAKFVTPSEIQALLIPRALAGVDILGQARTGTGKTAAFAIPVLQRVARGVPTQAIMLVPTRELCVQVESEIRRLAQFTPIRVVAVYGGQRIVAQMKQLEHGPEILVGTPGRVIDLLDRGLIDFANVRFVVLDEVDRMLDIGFRDDIRNILSRVKGMRRRLPREDEVEADRRRAGVEERGGEGTGEDGVLGEDHSAARGVADHQGDDEPEPEAPTEGERLSDERSREASGTQPVTDEDDFERGGEPSDFVASADADPQDVPFDDFAGHQTIFVSATISPEIERLGRRYMREPVEKLIAPGADDKPTVEKVAQAYFAVEPWDKYRLLRALLERERPDLAIVFCRTKRSAEKLAARLTADGIECREIHGNLNQNQRDRVMQGFRKGKFDVLVATDLASRGIDVADISHIVNYDIPDDPEVYVHRVGRTARMGAAGKAYTFVSRGQGDELNKVEALINMVIPAGTLEGWEPRPQPGDWVEGKPGVERQGGYGGGPGGGGDGRAVGGPGGGPEAGSGGSSSPPGPAAATPAEPPRRLGSKIPLGRRHKRLR
ncbi:MAG: hypothetical protein JWO31_176 [Phycisphaerales bacterium]|nr:hypothetical protein [Phycisphaerales bacterium]